MTDRRATRIRPWVLGLIGAAGVLAGCGDGGGKRTDVDEPVTVASVEVAPSNPRTLAVGDTLHLTATVKDADGNTLNRPVTWSSDHEDVAQVSDAGVVTAWGAGSASITATSEGKSASLALAVEAATPVQLADGAVVGKDSLPPGDTPQGGQGDPVSGISCASMEQLAYHIHAHLSLIVNGEQLAVPPGIGAVDGQLQDGYVQAASCFYWLHTHDATGIVHVESPNTDPRTLGELFDVWGRTLTTTSAADFDGPVTVFVDGARYTGDPRTIVFADHMQITLEVGTPLVPPPVYQFPPGY